MPRNLRETGLMILAVGLTTVALASCSGENDPNSHKAIDEEQPVRTDYGVLYPRGTYTLEQLDNSNEVDIDLTLNGKTIDTEESEKRLKEARREINRTPSADGSEPHVHIIDLDTRQDFVPVRTATAITDKRAAFQAKPVSGLCP